MVEQEGVMLLEEIQVDLVEELYQVEQDQQTLAVVVLLHKLVLVEMVVQV